MTAPRALVIVGAAAARIGSLAVWERAVLVAHRVGLSPVTVWSAAPSSSSALARRGVPFTADHSAAGPFGALVAGPVIVIGPDVVVDAASLIALSTDAERGDRSQAIAVNDSGVPVLLCLPTAAVAVVRTCESLAAAAERLAATGSLRLLPIDSFTRRLSDGTAARLERDLVRHLNGGSRESFFTKIIRRFSVPLSIRLARLDVRPSQVTLAGLVVAVLSAWCISRGRYLPGLAGALLYYASMVLDCSDGEVARLSVRDSDFGAWFETVVDYATYVLLLAALAIAVRTDTGRSVFETAAFVAAIGSLVVAVVTLYLRHRVAAADPGRFDDSSAAALTSAGAVQRFARWGRQWIKRSTIAHLVVVLAIVNQLKALLVLWAFGATLGGVIIIAVAPFLVRRVSVRRETVRDVGAS
ncbi:MAG: CDP-alcohol phosphatidyltransferase family protein [Acidobacteria bacterium]|nr:CDP-alcohol phosphatidyltransferase family protein [Acidobacteriota bacterium]